MTILPRDKMTETYEPTDFAAVIFSQRYSLNGVESWEEACKRVAHHVASAEQNGHRSKWEKRFMKALQSARFIPGGRIWYGSGRPKGQLLNCFVVPTDDSREGWGKTVSDMLIISGTGGGVGMNFSPIRPRGTSIKGTGGVATGAVSLMEVINQTGEVIKCGGGRRTAFMMCLQYNHGDLEEFLNKKFNKVLVNDEETLTEAITTTFPYLPQAEREAMIEVAFSKEVPEDAAIIESVIRPLIKHQKDQTLKNANISVLVDQQFFDAVENEEDIEVMWRGHSITSYPAREMWDRVVENAWESGEPGILNIGLDNDMNNIHYH